MASLPKIKNQLESSSMNACRPRCVCQLLTLIYDKIHNIFQISQSSFNCCQRRWEVIYTFANGCWDLTWLAAFSSSPQKRCVETEQSTAEVICGSDGHSLGIRSKAQADQTSTFAYQQRHELWRFHTKDPRIFQRPWSFKTSRCQTCNMTPWRFVIFPHVHACLRWVPELLCPPRAAFLRPRNCSWPALQSLGHGCSVAAAAKARPLWAEYGGKAPAAIGGS